MLRLRRVTAYVRGISTYGARRSAPYRSVFEDILPKS